MAKVVLYLSIVNESQTPVNKTSEIVDSLPTSDKVKPSTKKNYSFDYKYEFNDVQDINKCNKAFTSSWHAYEKTLHQMVQDSNFKVFLQYDITIYNLQYPVLCFDGYFTEFLSKAEAVFTVNLYNE